MQSTDFSLFGEYFTPYSKVTAIFTQLEYRFNKNPHGFWKFLEPCKHRSYRKGDSWIEELAICRKTFNIAFAKIGTRYKSKTAFCRTEDVFQGKLYACYYDRDTNKMHYLRNHQLVNEFLKTFSKTNLKTKKLLHPKNLSPFSSIISEQKTDCRERKSPLPSVAEFRSHGGIIGGNIYIPSFKQINTTLERPAVVNQISRSEAEGVKLAEEMKKIWLEEIEDFGTCRMPLSFWKTLNHVLKTFFGGCLQKWRAFCQKIASSKFLMGEGNNRTFKKVWITWGIKEEIIKRIENGEFGLNTREKKVKPQETKRLEQIQYLEIEKKKIENSIRNIEDEVDSERRKTINTRIDQLSAEETEELKVKFIAHLEAQEDAALKESGSKFWQLPWSKIRFEWFVRKEMENSMNAPFLQETHQRVEKSKLRELLAKVKEDIFSLQSALGWRC